MSILYSAEGGFELPQRTFDALVKIAHYYNCTSATLAAAASDPWKATAAREGGLGRDWGGGEGLEDEPSTKESTTTSLVGGRPTPRVGGNGSLAGENDASDDGVALVADRGNAPTDNPADSFSPGPADNDQVKQQSSSPGRAGGSTESATDAAVAAAASTRTEVSGGGEQGGSEGGGGAGTAQQRTAPRKEKQQQPVGDDWYTEGGGRPSSLARRNSDDGSSGAKQQGGEGGGEDAWSRTAREITRLWVRAVGSLCTPSHSELWPHLLEVGIFGALNT